MSLATNTECVLPLLYLTISCATTGLPVVRPQTNLFQHAHADVGVLTAAPLSAQPGLQLLQQVSLGHGSPSYRWQWVDIEAKGTPASEGQEWVVFSGEVLAVITGNGTRYGQVNLLSHCHALLFLLCCFICVFNFVEFISSN